MAVSDVHEAKRLVDVFFCVGLNSRDVETRAANLNTEQDEGIGRSDEYLAVECNVGAVSENPLETVFPPQTFFWFPKERIPPANLALFCFPDNLRIICSNTQPQPRHHSFVVTDDTGVKQHASCLTFFEPLHNHPKLRRHFIQLLEHYQKTQVSPSEWEFIQHTREKLGRAYQDLEQVEMYHKMLAPFEHILVDFEKLYVPKCIGLVGLWPFYTTFHSWLGQLLHDARNGVPIERFLTNLLLEIPLPPPGKLRLKIGNNLFCSRPPLNAIPVIRDYPLYPLFQSLSIENVVRLMECVISEQKILLVSSHLPLLSIVAEALCLFLFPLNWQHIFIPVLPASLLAYIHAPVPYIIGIHSSFREREEPPPDAVIVNLDKNTLYMPRCRDNRSITPSTYSGVSQTSSFTTIPIIPFLPPRERRKLLSRLSRYVQTRKFHDIKTQVPFVCRQHLTLNNDEIIAERVSSMTSQITSFKYQLYHSQPQNVPAQPQTTNMSLPPVPSKDDGNEMEASKFTIAISGGAESNVPHSRQHSMERCQSVLTSDGNLAFKPLFTSPSVSKVSASLQVLHERDESVNEQKSINDSETGSISSYATATSGEYSDHARNEDEDHFQQQQEGFLTVMKKRISISRRSFVSAFEKHDAVEALPKRKWSISSAAESARNKLVSKPSFLKSFSNVFDKKKKEVNRIEEALPEPKSATMSRSGSMFGRKFSLAFGQNEDIVPIGSKYFYPFRSNRFKNSNQVKHIHSSYSPPGNYKGSVDLHKFSPEIQVIVPSVRDSLGHYVPAKVMGCEGHALWPVELACFIPGRSRLKQLHPVDTLPIGICAACNEDISLDVTYGKANGWTSWGMEFSVFQRPETKKSQIVMCSGCHLVLHVGCVQATPHPCPHAINEAKVQDAFFKVWTSLLKSYRSFLDFGQNIDRCTKIKRTVPDNMVFANECPVFNKQEFMGTCVEKDARPFMHGLLNTQAFAQFAFDRVEKSENDYEVLFFDEAIKAKLNRSKIKMTKELTPFFKNDAYTIKSTYDCIEPNLDYLELSQSRIFPESLIERNLLPPRKFTILVTQKDAMRVKVYTNAIMRKARIEKMKTKKSDFGGWIRSKTKSMIVPQEQNTDSKDTIEQKMTLDQRRANVNVQIDTIYQELDRLSMKISSIDLLYKPAMIKAYSRLSSYSGSTSPSSCLSSSNMSLPTLPTHSMGFELPKSTHNFLFMHPMKRHALHHEIQGILDELYVQNEALIECVDELHEIIQSARLISSTLPNSSSKQSLTKLHGPTAIGLTSEEEDVHSLLSQLVHVISWCEDQLRGISILASFERAEERGRWLRDADNEMAKALFEEYCKSHADK